MKQKKSNALCVLLSYAGSHKRLTFLGLTLSAVSMLMSMAPYICIWLVARDLIAVAPNWMQAQSIARYGWMAFGFSARYFSIYSSWIGDLRWFTISTFAGTTSTA